MKSIKKQNFLKTILERDESLKQKPPGTDKRNRVITFTFVVSWLRGTCIDFRAQIVSLYRTDSFMYAVQGGCMQKMGVKIVSHCHRHRKKGVQGF